MKTPHLIHLCSAVLALTTSLAHAQSVPETENPFAMGTGAVVVDEETQRTLREYSLSSANRLSETLRDTAGLVASEALPAMERAVREVVIRSYSIARGRELLFRIVLNQALELTSGRPHASGTGVESLGVLAQHPRSPAELSYRILRDSMALAQQYAQRDAELDLTTPSAMPSASLPLPYNEAAQARLLLARGWNRSITLISPRTEYTFLRVLFTQWLHLTTLPQNVRTPAQSAQIVRVQTVLAQYGALDPAHAPVASINEGKRRLRGLLLEFGTSPVESTARASASAEETTPEVAVPATPPGTAFEIFTPLRPWPNYGVFTRENSYVCLPVDSQGNRIGTYRDGVDLMYCAIGSTLMAPPDDSTTRLCYLTDGNVLLRPTTIEYCRNR